MSERTEWAVVPIGDDGKPDIPYADDEITWIRDSEMHAQETARRWNEDQIGERTWVAICRTVTETEWVEADAPKDSPLDAFLVTRAWLDTLNAHIEWWADDERRASIRALLRRPLDNEPHQRSRR